jgi:hypothetical protein
MNDLSDEETDDPLYADRRNFYKVEKRSRDGLSRQRSLPTIHDLTFLFPRVGAA